MIHEVLSGLIERWNGDTRFRAEVRADPVAAIERTGVALSEEQRAAVRATDWSLSDAELARRASHFPL
jgi:hypothetical protein